jgi:hypothetical protein
MSVSTVAGLGALGGKLLGASQSNKAAKREADAARAASAKAASELRVAAAPFMEQLNYAMPRFRSLIESEYAPKVGADNPFLAAQHQLNESKIGREENAALANSRRYWSALGDLGRSRGEALRIGRNATEEMNRENLNYGVQQQGYRNSTADRLASALEALSSAASPGVDLTADAASAESNGAVRAANIRAAGAKNYWNSAGPAFGEILKTLLRR